MVKPLWHTGMKYRYGPKYKTLDVETLRMTNKINQ